MKIAHVSFMKDFSPGVKNRVMGMAQGARKAGIENMDFYYLTNTGRKESDQVHFVQFREKIFPLNYYDFLFNRYRLIEKSIPLEDYDYIILRYPSADPSGINFMKEYKVITEHHTLEIQQSQSYLNTAIPPVIRATKMLRMKLESEYGSRILWNLRGIIGVTDEIRDAEISRTQKNIPSTTIPNGITVENINQTGFKPFDGKRLDLVMTVGSFYPWHGLDRIILSINRYNGPVNVRLHLIGNITGRDIRHYSPDLSKIRFHSYKSGHELDELMKEMNCAVGSLALFRVGLSEGCTLKTREYTARGMPFVIGYPDTDLQAASGQLKFFHEVIGDDLPLDMEEIIDFVGALSKNVAHESVSEYMRQYAFQHMDWSVKIHKYVEFVQTIDRREAS